MNLTKQQTFDGLSETIYSISAKYMSMRSDAAAILKYIAAHEDLSFFFKKLIRGIDYQKEFYNNMSVDKYGNNRFTFPDSKRSSLALMLGILKDIDTDEINFPNFISLLYPDLKPEIAYELFCKDHMPVFLDNVYALYVREDVNKGDFDITSINRIDTRNLINDLTEHLNDLTSIIADNRLLTQKKCDEYMQYLDAFKQSLVVNDIILINNSFRVLKEKLSKKKYRDPITKIANILNQYGII